GAAEACGGAPVSVRAHVDEQLAVALAARFLRHVVDGPAYRALAVQQRCRALQDLDPVEQEAVERARRLGARVLADAVAHDRHVAAREAARRVARDRADADAAAHADGGLDRLERGARAVELDLRLRDDRDTRRKLAQRQPEPRARARGVVERRHAAPPALDRQLFDRAAPGGPGARGARAV